MSLLLSADRSSCVPGVYSNFRSSLGLPWVLYVITMSSHVSYIRYIQVLLHEAWPIQSLLCKSLALSQPVIFDLETPWQSTCLIKTRLQPQSGRADDPPCVLSLWSPLYMDLLHFRRAPLVAADRLDFHG
jgi:hypothetical protein